MIPEMPAFASIFVQRAWDWNRPRAHPDARDGPGALGAYGVGGVEQVLETCWMVVTFKWSIFSWALAPADSVPLSFPPMSFSLAHVPVSLTSCPTWLLRSASPPTSTSRVLVFSI